MSCACSRLWWLTLRKSGEVREEQVHDATPGCWQDQINDDTSSEAMDPSRSNTFVQDAHIFNEESPQQDGDNIASGYSAIMEGQSMPGALVFQSGQRPAPVELSSVVVPSQAGMFHSTTPPIETAPSTPEPVQTQCMDWGLAKPTADVSHFSTTTGDKTMQSSQLQHFTISQTLCVPVTFSMTYSAPTLPVTSMAQHSHERAFLAFPSAAHHRAMPAGGGDPMVNQQQTVEGPYGGGYFPHTSPVSLMTPTVRAPCGWPTTPANQMESMVGGPFSAGSPSMGRARSWSSFPDLSQGMQPQLTDLPVGSPWGGVLGGWSR